MEIPVKYRADIALLESRVKALLTELKVPLSSLTYDSNKGITQSFIFTALDKTKEQGKYIQTLHNLIVPLIGDDVLSLLRIPGEYRKHAFIAGLMHDVERIEHPETVDRKHLKPYERELIKTHPTKARELLLRLNEPIAANIAGLHHAWQPDAYPNPIPFDYSQKEKALSIILALDDFYHRASISTNGRTPRSWFERRVLDQLIRGGRPSPQRVEAALRTVYGNQEVKFDEKIQTTGNQLINTLYSLGIFGQEDILGRYRG